jgi:hypothetical protein
MSGWTADRFGARTVFRAAIGVFKGSIGAHCRADLAIRPPASSRAWVAR